MGFLKRALLGRRVRTVLWLSRHLAPVRWVVSTMLVAQAKRSVRDSVCERTPLPTYTCHQMARRVRKSGPARSMTKAARKRVGGILKKL